MTATLTPRTEAPGRRDASDASLAELLTRVGTDAKRLVAAELALARAELAHKARRAAAGVGLIATAVVVAIFALGTFVDASVDGIATAEALVAKTHVRARARRRVVELRRRALGRFHHPAELTLALTAALAVMTWWTVTRRGPR
jgi:hypothetical protein